LIGLTQFLDQADTALIGFLLISEIQTLGIYFPGFYFYRIKMINSENFFPSNGKKEFITASQKESGLKHQKQPLRRELQLTKQVLAFCSCPFQKE
jgi:hypothetical protein